jgi:hypothetical protein
MLTEHAEVPRANQVELDRVFLRLYHSPALLTHLKDVRFVDDDTAELEFAFLPTQAVQTVAPLIGPIKVEAYQYEKDGEPRHGFKFKTSDLAAFYKKTANTYPQPVTAS